MVFTQVLFAQDKTEQCAQDAVKFCPDKKTSPARLDCLMLNQEKLSSECRRDLHRLSQIVKDTGTSRTSGGPLSPPAMGGMGLLPPSKKILSFGGTLAPEEISTTHYRMNAATPLWSWDEHATALSLNTQRLEIDESKEIKGGPEKTARRLDRIEVGGLYTKKLDDGHLFGGRIQAGSSSDKAFHSNREMIYTLMGFYGKPASGKNYWLYSVFISNNNPIANYLPLPGILYFTKKDNFSGMFGFPFNTIQWTPVSQWSFSLSYLIANITAEVAYQLKNEMQVSLGFGTSQQMFLLHDRKSEDKRLFFTENRLYLGMKSPIMKYLMIDAETGLNFYRRMREGRRFNNTDLLLNMKRSWFLSSNFTFLF